MSSNESRNTEDDAQEQHSESTTGRTGRRGNRSIISQIESRQSNQQTNSDKQKEDVRCSWTSAIRGSIPNYQESMFTSENLGIEREESGDSLTMKYESDDDIKGDIYVIPPLKMTPPVLPKPPKEPLTATALATAGSSINIQPPEDGSTNIQTPEGGSTNIQTHEGGSTNIKPPEGGSTKIKPPEGGSTNIKPPEGGSTKIKPPEGGSTNIQTPESGGTNIKPPEGGSTNIQTPEGGSTNIKPPEGGSTNIETPEGGSTDIKPPECGSINMKPPKGGSTNIQTPEGGSTNIQIPEGGSTNIKPPEGGCTNIQTVAGGYINIKPPEGGSTSIQSPEGKHIEPDTKDRLVKKTKEAEKSQMQPAEIPSKKSRLLKFIVDGGSIPERSRSADRFIPKKFNEDTKSPDMQPLTKEVSSSEVVQEKRKSVKEMLHKFEPSTFLPKEKANPSKDKSKTPSPDKDSFRLTGSEKENQASGSRNTFDLDKDTPRTPGNTAGGHPLHEEIDNDRDEDESYETAEEDQNEDSQKDLMEAIVESREVKGATVIPSQPDMSDKNFTNISPDTSDDLGSNNAESLTRAYVTTNSTASGLNQLPSQPAQQQPVVFEGNQPMLQKNTELEHQEVTPVPQTTVQQQTVPQLENQQVTSVTERASQHIEQHGRHGGTPPTEFIVADEVSEQGGQPQVEQPDYTSHEGHHIHHEKPTEVQPMYEGLYKGQREEEFHQQAVDRVRYQDQHFQPLYSQGQPAQLPHSQGQPIQIPHFQGYPIWTHHSHDQHFQPPYSQGQPTQPPHSQGPTTQPPHSQGSTTQPPHSQDRTTQQPHSQGPTTQPPHSQGPTTQPPHSQGQPFQPPYSQGQPFQPPYSQGQPFQPPHSQGQPSQPSHSRGQPHQDFTQHQYLWQQMGGKNWQPDPRLYGHFGNRNIPPQHHQVFDPQHYHMYNPPGVDKPHTMEEDHLYQEHERGTQGKPEEKLKGKPEEKPKGKPEEKPKGKPEEKPKGKPEEKPKGKPEEKPKGKPREKLKGKPEEKPKGKPEEKPKGKPNIDENKKKDVVKPKKPEKTYVCVKGLAAKTELDTLCMFLENKSGGDVDKSSIFFTNDKTIAVATLLQTLTNFEEFKTKCHQKKLEGVSIKVCLVPAPVTVIISSDQHLPSERDLKEHFKQEKFGGVKVKNIKMTDDGCYRVDFKDNAALEKVCHSPYPHRIHGTSLCVTALYECEFGEIWEVDKHKVCIPEDIELTHDDHHKIVLVKKYQHVTDLLQSQLKPKLAKLKVTDQLFVECTMDQTTEDVRHLVKVWESDIKQIWNEFINETVQQREILVTLEVWKDLIGLIREHEEHKAIHLDYKEYDGDVRLVVVGVESVFSTVTDNIHHHKESIENAIERKKQITTITKSFKPLEIRLLGRLEVLTQVNSLVDDLHVTGSEELGTITFTGVMEDIKTAEIIIKEAHQFCIWTIQEDNDIRKDQVRLLQNPEVLDMLKVKFSEHKLVVEFDCEGDTLEIGTVSASAGKNVTKIVSETVLYSDVPLTDKEKIEVLDTAEWRHRCRQTEEKDNGLVIISTKKDYGFTVTSIDIVHHDTLRDLLTFTDDRAKYNDAYDIKDENKRKFFEKHYLQEIKELEIELSSLFVSIQIKNKRLALTGTRMGINQAKDRLKELEKRIQTRQHDIQKVGICTVVSSDNPDMFSGIENATSTLVIQNNTMTQIYTGSQESSDEDEEGIYGTEESHTWGRKGHTGRTGMLGSLPEVTTPQPSMITKATSVQTVVKCKNGLNIKLVKGEIGKEKADVLIVSTSPDLQLDKGGAGKSLLKYGGIGLQAELKANYPTKINHGDVITIGPGKLKCKEVFLCSLPDWEKDKNNKPMVITKVILQCLNKAARANYNSIKFVALGTGALKYPPQTVAEAMYEAVREFDAKGTSSVLLVNFLLYSGDHQTISAFEDEEYKQIYPGRQTGPRAPLDTKHGIKVTLVKGLMENQTVDVIACATPKNLNMVGGVAKGLATAAGPAILQADCKAKYPSGIEFGGLAIITNGNLKTCKSIYLTSLPSWQDQDGTKHSNTLLNTAITACLQKAAQSGMKSIAFPAFGTGQNGYPKDTVAKLMYSCVIDFATKNTGTSLTDVRFVLHPKDWQSIMAFENEEQNRQPFQPHTTVPSKSFFTKTNRLQVSIEICSIAEFKKADVISATVAENLDISKGSAMAALASKCGPTLTADCDIKYPNGIKIGDLAEISPGNLSCKALYLGTLPSYNIGAAAAERALDKYIQKVLKTASSKGYTSVAFPAVGTGFNRYPHNRAATLCYEAVQHFDKKPSSIKVVYFTILQKDVSSLQAFQREEEKRNSFPYGASKNPAPFSFGDATGGATRGATVGATRGAKGETRRGTYTRVFSKRNEEDAVVLKRQTTRSRGMKQRQPGTQGQGHPATLPAGSNVGLMSMRGDNPNQFLYGKVTLKVNVENIVKLKEPIDVIVNSTNKELDFTKGAVSKDMMKECNAKQMTDECDKLKQEMKSNGMVFTSGCGLSCKTVLHLEAQTSLKNWQKMILSCLQEVDKRGHTSVAFPALGTAGGSVQFKPEEIAEMFHETLLLFSGSNLTLVRLVIFDPNMLWNMIKVFRDNIEKPSTSADFGVIPGTGPSSDGDLSQVSLWILCASNDNIEDAIDMIKKLIDKKYLFKSVHDTLLADLDDNEMRNVEKIKERFLITMKIDKQSSVIELEGPQEEVGSAMEEVHRLLRHFQKERFLDGEANFVLTVVQWFYKETDSQGMPMLSKYPPRVNMGLENSRKGNHSTFRFWANNEEYEVDVLKMKEYSLKDPTDSVDVIRREVQKESAIEKPSNWEEMGDPNVIVEVFPLVASSQEYQDLETMFRTSVLKGQYANQFNASKLKVHKIERIQNLTLFQQYSIKKQLLAEKNPKGTTNEQMLWHGTGDAAVTSINYYGFNRSYCGGDPSKGQCWYGAGVYFANDASYSARDWVSVPSNQKKKMYLCKVLTGVFCEAKKDMKYLPPLKTNPSENYDCAVHPIQNPLEFVIFNDTQAYPEFLITFSTT